MVKTTFCLIKYRVERGDCILVLEDLKKLGSQIYGAQNSCTSRTRYNNMLNSNIQQ